MKIKDVSQSKRVIVPRETLPEGLWDTLAQNKEFKFYLEDLKANASLNFWNLEMMTIGEKELQVTSRKTVWD